MALVISRRFGECIKIGPDITIWVTPTKNRKIVRVCMVAPPELRITREDPKSAVATATEKK